MYYSDKKTLVPEIVTLAILVGAGHLLFERYSFYYIIPKLDMLMHLLGGILIGLIILKLFFTGKRSIIAHERKIFTAIMVLIGVMIVGLGWELFEYGVGLTPLYKVATQDTLSDLAFDASGAFVATLWYFKKLWHVG
jgi:hypothetical protein